MDYVRRYRGTSSMGRGRSRLCELETVALWAAATGRDAGPVVGSAVGTVGDGVASVD